MNQEPAKDLDPRPKVELRLRGGGVQTVRLTVPESLTERYDLWLAAGTNYQRAAFAALGVCSADDPKVTGGSKFRGDVFGFGRAIGDHLLASGVSYASLRAAAGLALDLVMDGLGPFVEEIKAVEGNSEAPPATSTG